MTNYSRGAYYERKTKKTLEDEGYVSLRTAGSHGSFDIIAFNGSIVRFIQCKATRNKNPTVKSYKEELNIIKDIIVPECVTKELWIYSTNDRGKVIKVCVL